jgi:hypothetical protein
MATPMKRPPATPGKTPGKTPRRNDHRTTPARGLAMPEISHSQGEEGIQGM